MRVRSKPVTAEAVQWWKDGDHPAVRRNLGTPGVGVCEASDQYVKPGDWIVTRDGTVSVVSAKDFGEGWEVVGDEANAMDCAVRAVDVLLSDAQDPSPQDIAEVAVRAYLELRRDHPHDWEEKPHV